MPVSIVFQNLEYGASIEEIMDWYDVTRQQVEAVLAFAAQSLEPPQEAGDLPAEPVHAHSV